MSHRIVCTQRRIIFMKGILVLSIGLTSGCVDTMVFTGFFKDGSGSSIQTYSGISHESCASYCVADSQCLGLAFNALSSECKLYPTSNTKFSFTFFHSKKECVDITTAVVSDTTVIEETTPYTTILLQTTDFITTDSSSNSASNTIDSSTTGSYSMNTIDSGTGSVNSTILTTDSHTNTDSSSTAYTARCDCTCSLTSETLEEKLERIKSEMTINIDTLSSTKRKLTSAEDKRVSAQRIGITAVAFLIVMFVLFPILDILSLGKSILEITRNDK